MKIDISFAMVSIYQSLQLYSEAYDYLVEQARKDMVHGIHELRYRKDQIPEEFR